MTDDTQTDDTPQMSAERCLLLKAAQVVRDQGWCRGQFQNNAGEVCFHGAIGAATAIGSVASDKIRRSALALAGNFVKKHKPEVSQWLDYSGSVPVFVRWNDTPWSGATKEQVIEILEGAAAMPPVKESDSGKA